MQITKWKCRWEMTSSWFLSHNAIITTTCGSVLQTFQPLMLQLLSVHHAWSCCNVEHKSWLINSSLKKVVENRTSDGRRCISIGIASIFCLFVLSVHVIVVSLGVLGNWCALLHALGSAGVILCCQSWSRSDCVGRPRLRWPRWARVWPSL